MFCVKLTRWAAMTLLLAICLPSFALASGGDDEDWVQSTGDILQIALPLLGGGATFFTNPDSTAMWDKEGTKQFAKSFGLAWSTTYLIKIVAGKARPNGANRTSFPSGHTMSAFAGAAFIDGRYGRTFGIPALALAGFTGYSRVVSKWHYQDDVIAGASIGMMSNWLLVSPLPGKVQFVPTVDQYGYGMRFSLGGGEGAADEEAEKEPRGAAYHFRFGPAFVGSNTAGSQGAGDTQFSLSGLEGFNDPTTTANVNIRVPVSQRGSLDIGYGPFEARDQGSYTEDVQFGGEVFTAGSELDSSWRFYDLSLRYNYLLAESTRWRIEGSGGVGVMYSYAQLATQNGATSALVDDETIYPFLGVNVEYSFTEKWALALYSSGIAINDDWVFDAGTAVVWSPVRAWDMALGYTYFSRKIETDKLYNKANYNIPFLSISRYW